MRKLIKKFGKKIFNKVTKVGCKYIPYQIGPILAKLEYQRITGRSLNLKDPQNLIEKIVWMQFHTDTSLWTLCADKYAVRNFVEEKGLGHILPNLYGKWNKVDEIDWSYLPNKFVLKTNNSCGQNILVKDKSKLDLPIIKRKLKEWLKQKYAYHNAQLHYLHISPTIIAEQLLEDPSLTIEENLFDYKIFCFNGKPECIMLITERKGTEYLISFYDLKWNNISQQALNIDSSHYGGKDVPKPKNLDKMIEYAKILSQGFPHVRVDFYNIDGKIYFGEMTFTPGYGNRSLEFSEYLGSKIDLTKIKRIR